ncbi:uncharacterized protein BDV17DRAFT_289586 [Aspergillus undulatus]|uniref:uncharacterized protein n=1 Tax=Aspergillus undulatus TaxID=1810928 RepID=UPI003CCD486E
MSLGQADPGADAVYVPVQLPSLFVLFLSKTPDLNPHYAEAKVRVGKVVGRVSLVVLVLSPSRAGMTITTASNQPVKRSRCRFDERARTSLEKTDFSYFCSVAAPKAGREELRTICDWTNWVFPFDDNKTNQQTESVPHNLVSITWHTRPNLSAQSAFDSVSAMLNDRYRDWYTALSEFPSWGGPVDAHVRGYVEGVRAVVRANLGWRFVTPFSFFLPACF